MLARLGHLVAVHHLQRSNGLLFVLRLYVEDKRLRRAVRCLAKETGKLLLRAQSKYAKRKQASLLKSEVPLAKATKGAGEEENEQQAFTSAFPVGRLKPGPTSKKVGFGPAQQDEQGRPVSPRLDRIRPAAQTRAPPPPPPPPPPLPPRPSAPPLPPRPLTADLVESSLKRVVLLHVKRRLKEFYKARRISRDQYRDVARRLTKKFTQMAVATSVSAAALEANRNPAFIRSIVVAVDEAVADIN